MSVSRFLVGLFGALVLDHGFVTTAKGMAQFFLKLKICGRYTDGGKVEACPPVERTVLMSIPHERGVYRFLADLEAIGVHDLDDLGRLALTHANPLDLRGRQVDLECGIDNLNGGPVQRINIRRIKPMTPEDIQALQARFGSMLAQKKEGGATPAPAPSPAAA